MQGYRFTLRGEEYRTASLVCSKGFVITLPEGDPRLSQFRNACFKEEPVSLPEDFGKPAAAVTDGPPMTDTPPVTDGPPETESTEEAHPPQLIPLDEVEGIPPAVVAQLKEAGYETAQAVAALTPEEFDLTSLKGVGLPTAEKIMTACNEAIAAAP